MTSRAQYWQDLILKKFIVLCIWGILACALILPIKSCHDNKKAKSDVEKVWKPIVENLLIDGINTTSSVPFPKSTLLAHPKEIQETFGKGFRQPYTVLWARGPFNPLNPAHRLLTYELYNPAPINPLISFKLLARDLSGTKTLIVIRENTLDTVNVSIYAGGSASVNLEDWYVTFIDMASKRCSPTFIINGALPLIDDKKYEEFGRIVMQLNE